MTKTTKKSSNIRAKKSLGQNFLINEGILDKIVQAAEVGQEDIVVEIGPGTGNLTEKLSEKAKKVIAIEKDRRLTGELREKFKNSNVEIIEDDILKFSPHKLQATSYKVVGNIPYYITSHFLRIIFDPAGSYSADRHPPTGGKGRTSSGARKWPKPEIIVLTIQKEVAQRIVSKAGNMNLLALSVQLYSDPEIIMIVSRGSFRPVPNVDSAVIKLTPNPKTDPESIKKILGLAKKAFSGKRKQLKNTLKEVDLAKSGIPPETRPEDLDVSDWLKIAG